VNKGIDMHIRVIKSSIAVLVYLLACTACAQTDSDPLPSWNDTGAKKSIIEFVEKVTKHGSPDFVPVAERIATFDNDGTLWSEQPLYFQGFYALDRIKKLSAQHPEWETTEPYKSAIAGDVKGLMATGEAGVIKVLVAAHSNTTAEDFSKSVSDWVTTSKHPQTGKPFTQMVFQPMLELLDYLRANDFKIFIVSGGGVDFMRVVSEEVYGIPPEQIIGTTGDAKYEMIDGIPVITKEPKILLVDDKEGKPVGINRNIGRRPIFAAGNSDGDMAMLEYTTIPRGADDKTPRFGLIVHHTAADREYAYDRKSSMGKLDKAMDAAPQQGWLLVDMKKDWKQIYPE